MNRTFTHGLRGLLLVLLGWPAWAMADPVSDLRAEVDAIKSAYEARIAQLEHRIADLELASTVRSSAAGAGAEAAAVSTAPATLLGALLLTWTEKKRPEIQEALIGILFVLASTAQILLLANDPHGGEDLKDLLAGQILWVSSSQLIRAGVLTAIFLVVWFGMRERIGRIGFYVLFAFVVTASVQLVGVYLVFSTLIVPAVAVYRFAPAQQLKIGLGLATLSYAVGLTLSAVTDLPSSPVVVWSMVMLGIIVHLLSPRSSLAPR